MKAKATTSVVIALTLILLIAAAAFAQEAMTPNVQVADTGVVDNAVTILEATVDGPGWVVIHADNDGAPGPVIGHAPLQEGANTDVKVEVDPEGVTPILHAMLHVDAGEVGTYEFPGPDVPVKVGDAIVMAEFSAAPVLAPETETASDTMSDESMSGEEMAPETMPMTGASASTSTPFILAIAAIGLAALGANMLMTKRRA